MKQPTIAALAATLSFLPAAQAELHDRGNGLIYDDVLDITWLQDANLFKTLCDAGDPLATDFNPPQWGDDASLCGYKGLMSWYNAEAWIAHLNGNHYLGYSDWRQWAVPSPTDDPTCSHQDFDAVGSDAEYDCTASELGHLFNVTLGNPDDLNDDCVVDGFLGVNLSADNCLVNTGPFENFELLHYWSGTEYLVYSELELAWGFAPYSGRQYAGYSKDQFTLFVWPVLDGDPGLEIRGALAKSLSSRSLVTPEAPANVGMVIPEGAWVLITARGASAGMPNALADTHIRLYRLSPGQPSEFLQENDDWGSNDNASQIAQLTEDRPLAPQEAALLVELDAGTYTAVASPLEGEAGEVVLGYSLIQ